MTLTTEQHKEAKKIAASLGLNTKLILKDLGNGFWEDCCNNCFEGYLSYIKNELSYINGSQTQKALDASAARYRAGKSGAASL